MATSSLARPGSPDRRSRADPRLTDARRRRRRAGRAGAVARRGATRSLSPVTARSWSASPAPASTVPICSSARASIHHRPGASDILGLEASGVVDERRRRGRGRRRPATRVMLLARGRRICRARRRCAQPRWSRVPDNIDLIDAGGIPEVFITAHDALFTRGRLQRWRDRAHPWWRRRCRHCGDSARAPARLPGHRHRGQRRRSSNDASSSAPTRASTTRTEDFVARTRELTDGRGADVVLDIMGASYLERNLDVVASDGRIVVIGMQGGTHTDIDLGVMMRRRISLISTALRAPARRDRRR